MADDGPSIPSWIYELRDLIPFIDELQEFGRDPREFILEIVLERLVSLILSGTEVAIGAIQTALGPLADVPRAITAPLFMGGRAIGSALGGIIGVINGAIVTVASSAGPAGPLVVIVLWGAIFIAAIRAAEIGARASWEILPKVIPWL